MVDMEKVETLTSLLEERSGLDIREAVACNINYLDGYEAFSIKMRSNICLKLSVSRRSRRSDFYNLRTCIFTKSEQRFLQKKSFLKC